MLTCRIRMTTAGMVNRSMIGTSMQSAKTDKNSYMTITEDATMNSTEFKTNTSRLRHAIAAAILLGAGGAASADPVDLSLKYSCPFPLIGTHTITANVASDMPAEMGLGVATGAFPINVDTSVPNDARVGLKLVGSATIEGTAITTNSVKLSDGSAIQDRKSTRLNSSHVQISYAVFCFKQ